MYLFIFSPSPSSPKIYPHHPNPPNFELLNFISNLSPLISYQIPRTPQLVFEISGPLPHLETGMLPGPAANGMYISYPSLQRCKDPKGRGYRNTKTRTRGWLQGNIVFCIHQGRCTCELTMTVTACTKPVQAQARYLS